MSFYQKNIGKLGEQKALLFLKDNGFTILKTNFRSRQGEIDLIAKKDRTVYFIEVKTRTSLNKGYPYEAVNKTKIFRLKKTANYFLLKSNYKDYKLKLGVISLVLDKEKDSLKFYDDLE
ncbi:YraN family protein [Candidatus Roizmanbacteria bacterium]|nr:YraN family protein [Candidatus Roizmanbacteria bacterium]